MVNSPVADALRFAVTQTVRALTQPGSIQAAAAELRQQGQPRLPASAGPPPPAPTAAGPAVASAAVELSPAALMPPVDAAARMAAARGSVATPLTAAMLEIPLAFAQARPGEPAYTADALRLAAQIKQQAEAPPVTNQPLAALLRSVSPQAAMATYEAMQPALRKRDEARAPPLHGAAREGRADIPLLPAPDASAPHDARAAGANASAAHAADEPRAETRSVQAPAQNAAQPPGAQAWSPTATQIMRGELAYQQMAPRPDTHARVDVYRFGRERDSAVEEGPETLGATIYLELPELGAVIVTLAITGRDVDLAVAAPARALADLHDSGEQFVAAADAWGVRVRGLSFVPFDQPPGEPR